MAAALLWGAYSLGRSQATYDLDDQGYAKQQAAAAAGEIQNECAGLRGPALAKCRYEIIDSSEQRTYDEQNLDAQRKVADRTTWFIILAVVELFLTGWGILVLRDQLRANMGATAAMREANKISKSNAEDAYSLSRSNLFLSRQTASETREASDRTYRAFLAAEDANLFVEFVKGQMIESNIPSAATMYFFDARITNIGRSSAILHGWSVGDERGSLDKTLRQDETHEIADRIMLDSDAPFQFIISYATPIRPRARLIVEANLIVSKAERKVRAWVQSHRIEEGK